MLPVLGKEKKKKTPLQKRELLSKEVFRGQTDFSPSHEVGVYLREFDSQELFTSQGEGVKI